MEKTLESKSLEKVEPGNIARRLSDLKYGHSLASSSTAVSKAIRSTHANILILKNSGSINCPDDADISSLVSELGSRRPSRIFIIDVNRQIQGLVESELAVRGYSVSEGDILFSEEIYLRLSKDGIRALPNLILANLVSDVPTVLVCLGSIDASSQAMLGEVLGHLRIWIEKLVFDSDHYHSYSSILSLVRSHGGALKSEAERENFWVHDLNWDRISKFREVVTEKFDAELFSNASENILEIDFSYSGSDSKISSRAFMQLCWIVERLGWVVGSRSESSRLYCKSASGAVRIVRIRRDCEMDPLSKFEFECAADKVCFSEYEGVEGIEYLVESKGLSKAVMHKKHLLGTATLVSEAVYSNIRNKHMDKILRFAPKIEGVLQAE